MKGEVPALTSLRMIAAWLVFVHHFPPSTAGLWGVVSRQGHVGVTVFFVLSGFLITSRYFRPWMEGRLRARDYFKKRVARILPLYYVVLALSLWLLGQPFEFRGARLPEWMMMQGLFWESLYRAAIPTSWSLTVEEFFYALAPLVFLAVAAVGGASRWWRAALVLGAITLLLLAAGAGLVRFSRAAGLATEWYGFLSDDRHMVIYTIFGRFVDFAVGIACALLYLRGDVPRLWARPRAAVAAGLGFALAATSLLAALSLMDAAGGVFGPRYASGWKYNPVVAAASGLAILSLTSPSALPTRALSLAPLVYLGRISYALYLVQMCPLGSRAEGLIAVASPAWRSLALYGAMNLVSAFLYELVEKPARGLTLRAADRVGAFADGMAARARAAPRRVPVTWTSGRVRAIALASGLAALALFGLLARGATEVLARGGAAPALAEALAVARRPDEIVSASLRSAPHRGGARRVSLPAEWLSRGPADGRGRFLVYVDGSRVPAFLGDPDPPPRGSYARWRGGRAGSMLIHCAPEVPCGDAVIVRASPAFERRLGWRRLRRDPAALAALVAVFLLCLAIVFAAYNRGLPYAPRGSRS